MQSSMAIIYKLTRQKVVIKVTGYQLFTKDSNWTTEVLKDKK